MDASSPRADRLTADQLPSRMTVPATGSGREDAASEEAAWEEAASEEDAASEDAAEEASDEADRSLSRTTVYQVWVAQSST